MVGENLVMDLDERPLYSKRARAERMSFVVNLIKFVLSKQMYRNPTFPPDVELLNVILVESRNLTMKKMSHLIPNLVGLMY